jgi:hypothetical protein
MNSRKWSYTTCRSDLPAHVGIERWMGAFRSRHKKTRCRCDTGLERHQDQRIARLTRATDSQEGAALAVRKSTRYSALHERLRGV